MSEKVFEYIQQTPIPLWKWILLHFVKTYKSFDTDLHVTVVCYAKMLFKKIYIWKIETYNSYNGKLIKIEKLARKYKS